MGAVKMLPLCHPEPRSTLFGLCRAGDLDSQALHINLIPHIEVVPAQVYAAVLLIVALVFGILIAGPIGVTTYI